MTSSILMKAILSMDSYNRGYDAGINIASIQLGNAAIVTDSFNLGATIISGQIVRLDRQSGFYAVAYDYNGSKIISYRGTDDFNSLADYSTSLDVGHGWLLGGGNYRVAQGVMALQFYNSVANNPVDTRTPNISFTGHSLGGGLASYAAALYGKNADVFDSMGYQNAAINAHFYASTMPTSDPQYNTLAKPIIDNVYKNISPWSVNFSNINATHTKGEILHPDFARQSPSTEKDLGDDVTGLDGIDLHSMSTLIIRLYANTESSGVLSWRSSAKYFWPVLYNDDLAADIGLDTDAKVIGELQDADKFSEILRTIIAYSAIDEGERPFGDTGIKALYTDANTLGKVTDGAFTTTQLENLSKAFVHFAGIMALNDVEWAEDQVLRRLVSVDGIEQKYGALQLSSDESVLAVDISSRLWNLGNADALTAPVTRPDVFGTVLSPTAISTLMSGSVGSVITAKWGGDHAFTRLYLPTDESLLTYRLFDPLMLYKRGELGLFYAPENYSTSIQTTYGSNGDDIIFVNQGSEKVNAWGGEGDDILITSGGGLVSGDDGDDYIIASGVGQYSGAGGHDILNLSSYSSGVDLTYSLLPFPTTPGMFWDKGYNAITNTSPFYNRFGGFDHIIFTGHNDKIEVIYYSATLEQSYSMVLDGGNGIDSINFGTLSYIPLFETALNQWDLGGYMQILNFEKIQTFIIAPNFSFSSSINLESQSIAIIDLGLSAGSVVIETDLFSSMTVTSLSKTKTITFSQAQYDVEIIGTNYGDVYDLDSRYGMIRSGTGDDEIVLGLNTINWNIIYTGGNDVIYLNINNYNPNAFSIFYESSNSASTLELVDVYTDDEWYNYWIFEAAGVGTLTVIGGTENFTVDDVLIAPNTKGSHKADTWTAPSAASTYDGGYGNDQITGSAQADNLSGGAGNDTILGNGGADQILGGWGNDYIMAGANTGSGATINGEAGNDYIVGGNGADYLYGEDGKDELLGQGGNDTIHGGDDDDIIHGDGPAGTAQGNDSLYGENGEDTFYISGGDDLISGGSGFDTLIVNDLSSNFSFAQTKYTESPELAMRLYNAYEYYVMTDIRFAPVYGQNTLISVEMIKFLDGDFSVYSLFYKPTINGTAGNDILIGTTGNDIINGLDGVDVIEGLAGNDTLNGGNGIDTLTYTNATSSITLNLSLTTPQNTGGAGLDTITNFENLTGSAYNDTLTGNTVANTIYGGNGNDVIKGGNGNDIIHGEGGNDTLDGEGATDTVSYETATSAVTVSLVLTTAQNTGGAGTDTISNFENLTGSTFNDTLTGSSGNNTILGGDGNDAIEGGLGKDIMNGGNGTDTLKYSSATAAITINLGLATGQATGGAGTDTIFNFENIIGSGYNDILTGNSGNNNILGGNGNDTIEGGAGDDTLNGEGGTDTVKYSAASSAVTVSLALAAAQNTGGAGIDTLSAFENLTGSAYADVLIGNDAANTILGGNGNDIIDGGAGNDILNGEGGTDTLTYTSATFAITINLGLTTAQATGGSGSDTVSNFENLTGSGFNDTLTGSATANTIYGGNGADTIRGNGGNDILYGDGGNDFLYGGAGADTLTGGAGGDRFMFESTAHGVDTITDFSLADDKIDIKNILVGYDPLTHAITDFVQITTSGANSVLKVDADGGGNSFVQIATITGVTGLTDESALVTSGNLVVA